MFGSKLEEVTPLVDTPLVDDAGSEVGAGLEVKRSSEIDMQSRLTIEREDSMICVISLTL